MLSLPPRYDSYRFAFPKDFLPQEIWDKYSKLLSKNQGVLTDPVEYLNESIQSVSIPGISDLNIDQKQPSTNNISTRLGKINREPSHDNTYLSPANPLDKINKEFKVTFRRNQGLYNYFMIYETIFHRICKPELAKQDEVLMVDIMDGESGKVISRVLFYDCLIDRIDGLDFDYSKVERQADTFDVTFKFNNIDFDFDPDTLSY